MSRPGLDLAARLRAGLEARRDAARHAEEERRRQVERLQQARQTLLADLEAFAREVGFIEVTASVEVVVLRFDGRVIRFEAHGPADGVRVRCDGVDAETRLQFNETMGKWVLVVPRSGASEEQRLFFDAGLSWLMDRGLGLREGAVPPPPAPGTQTPGRSH